MLNLREAETALYCVQINESELAKISKRERERERKRKEGREGGGEGGRWRGR